MHPVTSIQRPLLVLILFADSNVESSNIASLGIGFGYFYFRHRGRGNCSRSKKSSQRSETTLSELRGQLQRMLQNWCNSRSPRFPPFGPFPGSALSANPMFLMPPRSAAYPVDADEMRPASMKTLITWSVLHPEARRLCLCPPAIAAKPPTWGQPQQWMNTFLSECPLLRQTRSRSAPRHRR